MSRIRHAWAVLQPYLTMPDWRDGIVDAMDREAKRLHAENASLRASLTEAKARGDRWLEEHAMVSAHLISLRASLDDANATIARLSAEAKRRDGLMREAHALLGRAITDDGVPQP